MGLVKVSSIGITLDGYAAGPDQDLENPVGRGGLAVFEWFFPTRTFKKMHGQSGGETGVDDDFAAAGFTNVGAWILGRNMFGPVRGPWPDQSWKGWWGDTPPFHTPVFVLTNHKRDCFTMDGGTTFHFVTGGIEAALEQANEAAGDKDVRIGGGVSTIQQYLKAGLVDELHLGMVPALLGRGEHLFGELDLAALGYHCTSATRGEKATHFLISRGCDPKSA
jgi:dihydrofolate reductase